MKKKNSKAPFPGEKILKFLLPADECESIAGDYEEMYADLVKNRNSIYAYLWYWAQIVKSARTSIDVTFYWEFAMLRNYLKIALRNMRKQKAFTFINILGLSVGIACTILILLWVEYEFSYDAYHKNAGRLYRVVRTSNPPGEFYTYVIPGPVSAALRDEFPEIENAATLVNYGKRKLPSIEKSLERTVFFAEPSFLEMFDFSFIKGDPKTALENPRSAVITEDMAKEYFGDEDPMGKTISGLYVTGVIKNIPSNSHFGFDLLAPYKVAPGGAKMWKNNWPVSYVLLKKNVSLEEVNKKIEDVIRRHDPASVQSVTLQPLSKSHLEPLESRSKGQGLITYIYIFSVMAVVILLIACINFMNLSTARSTARFKEIGIKKVVGSSRIQIARQFLLESFLLTFIGLVFAAGLVIILLPSVNTLLGLNLKFDFSIKLVLYLTGILIISGIFAGSYPAVFLSSFQPVSILKSQLSMVPFLKKGLIKREGKFSGGSNFRNILVVVQFSLSIMFIICSLGIYRQLNYLKNKDLGFNKENIIMFSTHGWNKNLRQSIKTQLLKNPNVLSISFSQSSPMRWSSSGRVDWPGKGIRRQGFDYGRTMVDYDYLKTFNIKMAEGRFFSKEFPTDATDAWVVNETAVRVMGLEDPIGKRITMFKGEPYEVSGIIIGITKDYHTESLHQIIRPMGLAVSRGGDIQHMNVKINYQNIRETLDLITSSIKKIVPWDPAVYSFLDQELDKLYIVEHRAGKIVLYTTLLAVFVSCLGLLGLAVFSVEQRTKEIGIRKVLGASVSTIISMLSRKFAKWVLLANLLAWPAAYYFIDKWMQRFAFNAGIRFWIFFAAGVLALVIALLTVFYQSVKAARANPVDSLRYE